VSQWFRWDGHKALLAVTFSPYTTLYANRNTLYIRYQVGDTALSRLSSHNLQAGGGGAIMQPPNRLMPLKEQ